jgi:hypothetical protein
MGDEVSIHSKSSRLIRCNARNNALSYVQANGIATRAQFIRALSSHKRDIRGGRYAPYRLISRPLLAHRVARPAVHRVRL